MKGYNKLRQQAVNILKTKLSKKLYYHGIHHTLKALQVTETYLKNLDVKGEEAKLVRIGILLHDIGFTVSTKEHENHSIVIAHKLMTECGFSSEHIKIVEGLILATKIPQRPKNELERIIGDIDLDYLGGPDFYKISEQLFKELKAHKQVDTEAQWHNIQIQFLQSHTYHTPYALKYRQPQKEERLKELMAL
jgi:uncharacterized protein